jgi:hypothetical protein
MIMYQYVELSSRGAPLYIPTLILLPKQQRRHLSASYEQPEQYQDILTPALRRFGSTIGNVIVLRQTLTSQIELRHGRGLMQHIGLAM